jgi:hypothetical protein
MGPGFSKTATSPDLCKIIAAREYFNKQIILLPTTTIDNELLFLGTLATERWAGMFELPRVLHLATHKNI